MLLGPVRIRHAIMKGVAKLRTVGRTRPADQFNPARQIACTFFSSTTFCNCRQQWNSIVCCLSCWIVCRSSI